jgi:hypothetical protein
MLLCTSAFTPYDSRRFCFDIGFFFLVFSPSKEHHNCHLTVAAGDCRTRQSGAVSKETEPSGRVKPNESEDGFGELNFLLIRNKETTREPLLLR